MSNKRKGGNQGKKNQGKPANEELTVEENSEIVEGKVEEGESTPKVEETPEQPPVITEEQEEDNEPKEGQDGQTGDNEEKPEENESDLEEKVEGESGSEESNDEEQTDEEPAIEVPEGLASLGVALKDFADMFEGIFPGMDTALANKYMLALATDEAVNDPERAVDAITLIAEYIAAGKVTELQLSSYTTQFKWGMALLNRLHIPVAFAAELANDETREENVKEMDIAGAFQSVGYPVESAMAIEAAFK